MLVMALDHRTSVLDRPQPVLEPDVDLPQGDLLGALASMLAIVLAIGMALVAGLGYDFFVESKHAAVTQTFVAQADERACIAQYAPGERFQKPMKCAPGTRDVPATALSYPLARPE